MDNSQRRRRRKKKCIIWSCEPDPCRTVVKAKVILGVRRNWVINSHPYPEKKNQHLENPTLETLGLALATHTSISEWNAGSHLLPYLPMLQHDLLDSTTLTPWEQESSCCLYRHHLYSFLCSPYYLTIWPMKAKLISSLLTQKTILFPLPVFLVFVSVWIHFSSIWVARTGSWRGIHSPLHKGITSFLHPQNSLPYC